MHFIPDLYFTLFNTEVVFLTGHLCGDLTLVNTLVLVFSTSLLLSCLELSDAKVYEP